VSRPHGEDPGVARVAAPGSSRASAAALALLAAVSILWFLPLFTRPVSALTGDNVTHSLPMNHLVARALGSGEWNLWEPSVSFGFPVHAEGTSGLFHPLRWLVLGLFPLLVAHDLLYVASFLLTGVSAFLLGRVLGLGAGFALAGALAAAFSPAVLATLYNLSYAHSIAWSAVALVAFELWYARPSARRTVGLGVALALAVLAGYVPTAYALVLFLGLALAIRVALAPRRLATHAPGFAAALALGVGIAALQVLPLLELARHSVRQDSVAVLNSFPWQNFLVGLVFDPAPELYAPGRYVYFAAPIGSVLALVALPFLPLLRDERAWSYAGAIAVCVAAAGGPGGPVFELLRAVLPGFDRLRLLSPFSFVVLVPTSVLLAMLLREAARPGRTRRELAVVAAAAALVVLGAGSTLPAVAALTRYRLLGLGLLAASVLGLARLHASGRLALAPLLVVAVLLVEIAALRPAHRAMLPDSVLEEGRALAAFLGDRLREDPDARAMHLPSPSYEAAFRGMILQHWRSPHYESFVRASMAARAPFANVMDELPFAEANGALPLAGFPELLAAMQEELRGGSSAAPGTRSIDRFGVRWIVVAGDLARQPVAPDLRVAWKDPGGALAVLENPSVQPRYQWRPSGKSDVAPEPELMLRLARALPWVRGEPQPPVQIDAPSDGRVFVAIPSYPGWTATLDGVDVPVRPAEGIGMEIAVPAGSHRLALRFVPASFHVGLCVTLASLGIAVAVLARGRARAAGSR